MCDRTTVGSRSEVKRYSRNQQGKTAKTLIKIDVSVIQIRNFSEKNISETRDASDTRRNGLCSRDEITGSCVMRNGWYVLWLEIREPELI
jgi:hypothetical protein